MGIANLLELPSSNSHWENWFWHNRTDHMLIKNRINALNLGNLVEYPLDPVTGIDQKRWLKDHHNAHIAFNNVINFPSLDLENVNMKDAKQLQSWLWIHYTEHLNAHRSLLI